MQPSYDSASEGFVFADEVLLREPAAVLASLLRRKREESAAAARVPKPMALVGADGVQTGVEGAGI